MLLRAAVFRPEARADPFPLAPDFSSGPDFSAPAFFAADERRAEDFFAGRDDVSRTRTGASGDWSTSTYSWARASSTSLGNP